jgi:uncharacterized repeat protein (TIGR03803 family)
MKLAKIFLTATVILTAWLAAPQARAGVAFTNLAFFTYTNPPNYGWNFEVSAFGHASALVQGNDGNFYGTTLTGGDNFNGNEAYATTGNGTVFKMTPNGTFISLYSFGTVYSGGGQLDGSHPVGNLIKGADGNLYGTTYYGGDVPDTVNGTIFQITTNGALTTLYSFGSQGVVSNSYWPDGRFPSAGVVQDSAGNFYGTTTTSGSGDQGTIYQLTSGDTLNVLYSFPSGDDAAFGVDGGMPTSELTEGPDGNFYGTTYWGGTNFNGTIFRMTTNGVFTPLYSFSSAAGGTSTPLLLGKDANFYGTAPGRGNSSNGSGIIFQFTTNGVFTVLHTFFFDGAPSGLIQGSDGNFYGTTSQGGQYDPPYGGGTVFQMTTNGTVTTLYAFSGPDGQEPDGALVEGKDGNLYGTTSYGGPNWDSGSPVNTGYGTIFRITVPPAFQTITLTNGVASLTWSAMSNQTCKVQYNTNLASTNWINLGSAITVTNSPVSASDSSATDSQRFYRIMLTQ